ncbi:MAG: universal stress protein [Chloroflexota bacterium]
MYKKILVPLDGSEFSECSLEHVRAITRGDHVPEVILLRVIEPAPEFYLGRKMGGDFQSKVTEIIVTEAKDYLSKTADGLKKDGITIRTVVIQGKPAEEILDYAAKNQVDLIIMTTHGRSGVSRFAFGSVAEKVIRSSPLPVLSISPTGCRLESIE